MLGCCPIYARVTPPSIIREPESAIASLVRMRTREYEQEIYKTGGMIDCAVNTELSAVYELMVGTLRVMAVASTGARGSGASS